MLKGVIEMLECPIDLSHWAREAICCAMETTIYINGMQICDILISEAPGRIVYEKIHSL
jgi:hypothetical protein